MTRSFDTVRSFWAELKQPWETKQPHVVPYLQSCNHQDCCSSELCGIEAAESLKAGKIHNQKQNRGNCKETLLQVLLFQDDTLTILQLFFFQRNETKLTCQERSIRQLLPKMPIDSFKPPVQMTHVKSLFFIPMLQFETKNLNILTVQHISMLANYKSHY